MLRLSRKAFNGIQTQGARFPATFIKSIIFAELLALEIYHQKSLGQCVIIFQHIYQCLILIQMLSFLNLQSFHFQIDGVRLLLKFQFSFVV